MDISRHDELFLAGEGETALLARALDWAATPLGPTAQWPQSLKTAASLCLHSRFPMLIWWGPEHVMLYNDGYRPMLGGKHPRALGRPGREVWHEIWDVIGPMLEGVLAGGRATWSADQMLVLERNGFPEEGYFTFSYSPIFDESGGVGGIFSALTETTDRVLNERRMAALSALGGELDQARSVDAILQAAPRCLVRDPRDNAYVAIVDVDAETGERTVVARAGERDLDALVLGESLAAVCTAAARGESASWAPAGVRGSHGIAAVVAHAIPFAHRDGRRLVLVAALNARRCDDEAFRAFVAGCATRIGSASSTAHAYEAERARNAALAELDRAKTTFFSNVSHELRTPLTLILGPIEEAMAGRGALPEHLAAAHRNALRLRRLVNDLLDFSRIEAGRMHADLEPTALSQATAEIASLYRAAIEGAGLRFDVDCEDVGLALLDRAMWEKIVLNLVSNAYKFTLRGAIEVKLRRTGSRARLTVRDTGVGIAEADRKRLFERFYRVATSQGRTDEGSGIGLALVKELVLLHGGTIEVESRPGEGTEFAVEMPLAPAQDMPARPYEAGASLQPVEPGAVEAADASASAGTPAAMPQSRILVVDDNDDMASFIARLLSQHWRVERARNGQEALEHIRRSRPDVLVSDVMMPVMDGFALLAALRRDPSTRSLPVILVSARAGEEARLEGLGSGADDYLTKPFSARELVARVENQLMRSRLVDLDEALNRKLAAVFSHAPVGIALLQGPEHRYEFVNPAYSRLVHDRALLGRTVREAFPELSGTGLFEILDTVFAAGEPFVARSRPVDLASDATGVSSRHFFDFVYQPMPDAHGVVAGIAVVVFEVTALTEARREAEVANRAKDEFIAMLGHELRNPLAPILTALQLMRLRGEGISKEREIIERQVQHMVRLVNDLLDVARAARGNLELRKEGVDLDAAIADALETASPSIEQRRQQLEVTLPPGISFFADRARLAQVFGNLLTNASKFTPEGGRIAVIARAASDRAEIEVRDTGAGIPAGDLDKIFEPFVQGRQGGADRPRGGLGLGLAIASNIVRLHGGSISVASEGPDRGSVFTVKLPLDSRPERHQPQPAHSHALARGRNRSILVVDDNLDAARSLIELLALMGFEAQAAHDAPAALRVLDTRRFDIALLDIGLPVMDGYELARSIRVREDGKAMKLFALTGYGQEGDRAKAFQAGFDAHLVKPIDIGALSQALS